MPEQYKGYWIYGRALPGPPHTSYWVPAGIVLKAGASGSVVEVGRVRDSGFSLAMKELAEWFGIELSQMVVDECLCKSSVVAY